MALLLCDVRSGVVDPLCELLGIEGPRADRAAGRAELRGNDALFVSVPVLVPDVVDVDAEEAIAPRDAAIDLVIDVFAPRTLRTDQHDGEGGVLERGVNELLDRGVALRL